MNTENNKIIAPLGVIIKDNGTYISRAKVIQDIMDELINEYVKLDDYNDESLIYCESTQHFYVQGVIHDCGSYDNPYDEPYMKILELNDEVYKIFKSVHTLLCELDYEYTKKHHKK